MQGNLDFTGISSCVATHVNQAVQEAMVEVAVKARNLGYGCILFQSDSKRTVQVANNARPPCWQEQNLMPDLLYLYQNGLMFHPCFVTRVIVCNVYNLANQVASMPIHHSWVNPTSSQVSVFLLMV